MLFFINVLSSLKNLNKAVLNHKFPVNVRNQIIVSKFNCISGGSKFLKNNTTESNFMLSLQNSVNFN